MDAVDFGFLKTDVANEACVGDFAACGYLVIQNGEYSYDDCYTLVGRVVFDDALEEAAKCFGVAAVPEIYLSPWRSFLTDSCFPNSGAVVRAAMWCLYM